MSDPWSVLLVTIISVISTAFIERCQAKRRLDSNLHNGYDALDAMVKNAPPRQFPLHHGRLSLSFAGTVGDRGSSSNERLESAETLTAWLSATHLTPVPAPVRAQAFRRALQLREAIARCATSVVRAEKPPRADIALINNAAKRAARIALDPKTLVIVETGNDPVSIALGRIARDAIEMLGNADERRRLRACANDACGSIFLTPAGRRERRWCSMARCGNRAKASAHRARTERKESLGGSPTGTSAARAS